MLKSHYCQRFKMFVFLYIMYLTIEFTVNKSIDPRKSFKLIGTVIIIVMIQIDIDGHLLKCQIVLTIIHLKIKIKKKC